MSQPLADLLDRARLSPADVDARLHRLIAQGAAAVLDHRDAVPTKIRAATGYDVVAITRKHGRLLVSIEQRRDTVLIWTYREHSRNRCVFACPAKLTNAIRTALIDRPLKALADPGFALSDAIIESSTPFSDGWIEATVMPAWQHVERNRQS